MAFLKPGFYYDVSVRISKRNLSCDIRNTKTLRFLRLRLCHIKGSACLCLRLRRNENQALGIAFRRLGIISH